MIKVTNIEVSGIKAAIRGMRAPMKSYAKSDSTNNTVGKEDLKLMVKLAHAGTEHRKFLRSIIVSFDLDMPLFVWKEFDTYKVGVVTNSESTMHTLHKEELLLENGDINPDIFSMESLEDEDIEIAKMYIKRIKENIDTYNKTKDKQYWRRAIEMLPTSFMQKRTITTNMEVLLNIISQRLNHKLYEWNIFINTIIDNIPLLSAILTGIQNKNFAVQNNLTNKTILIENNSNKQIVKDSMKNVINNLETSLKLVDISNDEIEYSEEQIEKIKEKHNNPIYIKIKDVGEITISINDLLIDNPTFQTIVEVFTKTISK